VQGVQESNEVLAVSHACLLDKSSSEKGAGQSSEPAGARRALITVTASETAQNPVDEDDFYQQKEEAVEQSVKEYSKEGYEDPCQKQKIA